MLLTAQGSHAQTTTETPAPGGATQPPTGLMRWFDPSTAPFIPIPEIDVDPNSGTTIGLIPTRVYNDDRGAINKIFAPDILHNPYFGVGARARLFSYDSDDTQWSVVAGAKQHVEREFDYEFLTGRLRQTPWSFKSSLVFDRSGTTRFYGLGNESRRSDETSYIFLQKSAQATIGWNITHELQLSYTWRIRRGEVLSAALGKLPSIETRFSGDNGLGAHTESLSRVALSYDSRDDPTVPTHGGQYVIYGGAAAAHGLINGSMYRVFGLDARQLWTPVPGNTLAVHAALRYMPGDDRVPFWTLSSLGGDPSLVAEAQTLRGFGAGRFFDRNAFVANFEYRRRVLEFDAVATHIQLEVTPFLDIGSVFARTGDNPLDHVHTVGGVGFRGIAAPFVVGYVDIGYGSEGNAVFTGINYPF